MDEWLKGRAESAHAHNPEGHSLGIVGMGNIGYLLAKKAYHGLGMRIQYYDIRRRPQDQESLIEAKYFDTLDGLLADSDCIVVCVPFGGEKMFDAAKFATMKKGARFINVARGPLHDEAALAEALKSGHLSAAGLDVQEKEPEVHPELVKLPNVTLTPHNAGATVETTIGFEKLAMDNVEAFFNTGKGLTPVNVPR